MASGDTNSKKHGFDPALIAFVFAILVVVFMAGGYLAINNKAPFSLFNKGLSDTRTLLEDVSQSRPALLGERFHEGSGVLKHDAARTFKGLTLLQGTLPGGTQLRLIGMDGEEVHRWPIDFFALWPDPTHLIKQQIPQSRFNYHTQGVELLRDGSVIFNIGGKGDRETRQMRQSSVDGRPADTPFGNQNPRWRLLDSRASQDCGNPEEIPVPGHDER